MRLVGYVMVCIAVAGVPGCALFEESSMSPNAMVSPLAGADLVGFIATMDAGRCRAFYEEVLGFRVIGEDEFALSIDASGHPMRIQKMKEYTPQPFTILGWNVDDIEEVVTQLGGRGVRCEQFGFPFQDERGVATFPSGDRVAWLKDPDGNILSVAQMTRATPTE